MYSVVEINFSLRQKMSCYVVVDPECTMQPAEEIWSMCNPLKVGFPCIPEKRSRVGKTKAYLAENEKTGNQQEGR